MCKQKNVETLLRQILNRYIEANGMTRQELAVILEMPESTYTAKTNGTSALTFEEAHKISALLNVSLDVLYLIAS